MLAAMQLNSDPATPVSLVAPLLAQVQALTSGASGHQERFKLLGLSRWLRLLSEQTDDLPFIGQEASNTVIELVEHIDDQLEILRQHAEPGPLDWSHVRRHMLLTSRRHRLVSLAVALDDLLHMLNTGRGHA